MSQNVDVWLMLTPLSRHHARVGGPETDVQIGRDGVYGYKRPETDVQTGRDGVCRYKGPEIDV